MRKYGIFGLVLALTGAALGAVPAVAAPPAATPCAIGTPVPGDYDGDGGADQLIGVYRADQGVFQVLPSDGGKPYWIELGFHAERSVSADLNGDRCADAVVDGSTLILGSPAGLDTGAARAVDVPQAAKAGASEELVLRGAALKHDGIRQLVVAGWFVDREDQCCERGHFVDVFPLDAAGVPGTPQVIDLAARGAYGELEVATSGRSIAVGDGELKVKGKQAAGGVFMFSASAAAPTTMKYRMLLTQNSPRVPGSVEEGDWFGRTLSFRDGRLAIGAPGEKVGKVIDAGLVQPIRWHEATSTYTAYRAITQGTRGVVGTNEKYDNFGLEVVVTRGLTGTGSYDIAIGAAEAVGKAYGAGSVTVANFTKAGYRTYTQNSKGIPGTAERNDDFGSAIGVLGTSATTDTLLIGAPGESSGGKAGGYVIRSDGRKLGSATKWTSIPQPGDTVGTDAYWGHWIAR